MAVDRGNLALLPALKAFTIAKRRTVKLHSETSPEKSNLTRTGDMLSLLTSKQKGNKILIVLDSSQNEKLQTNNKLGFKFAHLSKTEYAQLLEELQNAIGG